MLQFKKPKKSRAVRHARKFRLRTDASRDTRCLRALNMQPPCEITERAIHHDLVMDGRSLAIWPEPMKFLVDMLNLPHWPRINDNLHFYI